MKRNNNWVGAAMLLLLTVLTTIGVRADNYKIVVWLNDGSKTELNISDMPEFVYADGNVSLKSDNAELSWPLAQLKKFTFEGIGSISYAMEEVGKTYGDAPFTNVLTLVGDGTVTYTSGNENVAIVDAATGEVTIVGAGTATITATAADGKDYTYTTKTISYTITVSAKALEDSMIDAIDDQTYTGTELKPAVTVMDGETVLTENTDYTVSYADNMNPGTATVTVTGMGNYSGTVSTTFVILSIKPDVETGVKDVKTGTDTDVWYDINGRKRQGEPVKNGLIIKNGKKMVVKDKQKTDK